MKLYPPVLERTIPAFYTNSEGTVLTVPFSMNRAVNIERVIGYQLKIKNIQSSSSELITTLTFYGKPTFNSLTNNYSVNFIISEELTNSVNQNKFTVGDFYKVQMAYIDTDNDVGYFSTVSVVKYTTFPQITILNLEENIFNGHHYKYTGVYSQKGKDTTEKAYSYRFILTDREGNIVDDTGIQLCDNLNNKETYQCNFNYLYTSEIPEDSFYALQLIVKTNNNMTVQSPQYLLTKKIIQAPEFNTPITASLNFNNGYIKLDIQGPIASSSGFEIKLTKEYLITRSSKDSNYETWEEIFSFFVDNQLLSKQILRDFTIEQGKTYVYGLQEKLLDGSYSSRIISEPIYADFEDVFLYDGDKQLKIRFNPKVSSLKISHEETKTDTLGGQFPNIFRNQRVKYKEVTIGGLISYLADEEELFMTNEELWIGNIPNVKVIHGHYDELYNLPLVDRIKGFSDSDKVDYIELTGSMEYRKRTVALEDYSIGAERIFKNEVMNWLSNGTVKLFRSPTEGNLLVYLMNVSFTPEDKTSRTTHSFQATAYQISDYTYKDLKTFNIYRTKYIPQWVSLQLSATTQPINYLKNGALDTRYSKVNNIWYLRGSVIPNDIVATSARFEGVTPGAVFSIRFKNDNRQSIIIGATGNYTLDFGQKIISIEVPNNACYSGIITYTYNIKE